MKGGREERIKGEREEGNKNDKIPKKIYFFLITDRQMA
jgi:hypothetical protein